MLPVAKRDLCHRKATGRPGGGLWETEELTEFHDAALAQATREINAVLERLAKKKPEPTSHLTFILFQNRHFLVWTTPGTVGSSTREDEAVRVRAWLDSPTYAFFQRLHVNVEVSVAPRFHVYGPPVPAGFVPLSMEVAPIEGVEIGMAEWPVPHPFEGKELDERFWVHEGTVRGAVPLTFSAPPGAGDHVIQVTLKYQACSDAVCLEPMTLTLSLPVREVALEGRELPGRERPR